MYASVLSVCLCVSVCVCVCVCVCVTKKRQLEATNRIKSVVLDVGVAPRWAWSSVGAALVGRLAGQPVPPVQLRRQRRPAGGRRRSQRSSSWSTRSENKTRRDRKKKTKQSKPNKANKKHTAQQTTNDRRQKTKQQQLDYRGASFHLGRWLSMTSLSVQRRYKLDQ